METKKITLSELKGIVKKILKEEKENNGGTTLRSLLDAELATEIDFSNYKERNKLIDKIEERLMQGNWISMSDGTTFKKSFTPQK